MARRKMTLDEQVARFGMSRDDAHALRDRALATLSPDVIAEARAAWQELAYEARGNRGQPWQWPQHPEAVRFHLLRLVADGKTVPEAVEAAREFAKGNDNARPD